MGKRNVWRGGVGDCKTRLMKVASKNTGWGLWVAGRRTGCGWLGGRLAVAGLEEDRLWVAGRRTVCEWLGGGLAVGGWEEDWLWVAGGRTDTMWPVQCPVASTTCGLWPAMCEG